MIADNARGHGPDNWDPDQGDQQGLLKQAVGASSAPTLALMSSVTIADRSLLISEFLEDGHLYVLNRPVLVSPGDRYWFEEHCLIVDDADGHRETHPSVRACR